MVELNLDKAYDDMQRGCHLAMADPTLRDEALRLEGLLFEAHDEIMQGIVNAQRISNGGKLTIEIEHGFDKLEAVRNGVMDLARRFISSHEN